MTGTLHVAWDERLIDYHFGTDHPLAPVRLELTMRLAHEFGLWDQPGVTVAAPALATVRIRPRPRPGGRPGDHGHPQRHLPPARADAAITSAPR